MLLDTAGRTHIDEPLMAEMAEIRDAARPHEILLVADALTGQDAVNLAKNFNERVGLTGIALTRMDGDSRGGAALSMRSVTGKPIKLIGVGEKMDALEDFHPARLADRILGMGDIVSLVEKAAQNIDAAQAAKMAEKMRKGVFDLNDLSEQLAQIEKLGGMGGIMGMLPGVAKMKEQLAAANLDDKFVKRQRAIISSMTPQERRNPDILKASRKKRIAAGSGVTVEYVNRLLKQHRQMADMMKAMGGAGKARHDGQARADDGPGRRHADADARCRSRRCRSNWAARGFRERPQARRAFPRPRRPALSICRRNSPVSAAARSCRALAEASTRSRARRSDSGSRNGAADPARRARKRLRALRGDLRRREASKPLRRRLDDARRRLATHGVRSSVTGRCAATATGRSRRRRPAIHRLGGLWFPGRLPGARGRLGPAPAQAAETAMRRRRRLRDRTLAYEDLGWKTAD